MRRTVIFLTASALVALGMPSAAQELVPADEARAHAMVNAARGVRGLPPLDRVDGLVALARQQSARMEQKGSIYHNPLLKAELDGLGLDWHWSGENVGVGPDVTTIQDAFLASQHHLENIVRANYTALGVGVLSDGDGYVYVTQVFAELGSSVPRLPEAPTEAPAAPLTTQPKPTPAPTRPPATPSPKPKPRDPIVIEGGKVSGGAIPATNGERSSAGVSAPLRIIAAPLI